MEKTIFSNSKCKVYIWDADKSSAYPPSEDLIKSLPDYYVEKYFDYKSETHKKQAIVSGYLLYQKLGIKKGHGIIIGPHGKIHLENKQPSVSRLEVSLSHSKSVTALAVSDSAIGVDVEHLRKVNLSVINKFFPDSFREAYLAELKKVDPKGLNPKDADTIFTKYWTRLEAALKADGRGLSVPRDEIQAVISKYEIITEIKDNLIVSIAF